jgi:hypothetical protein
MEIKMNTNEEKWLIGDAMKAHAKGDTDTAICLGLSQGDGWWGNMLANGHYISPRGDLASDYHDFCNANALEPSEVDNAKYFLKQFKLEQKINKMKKDFE